MLFFAHATRPQRARETFQLVESGQVQLCFSIEVIAEIRDVLTRQECRLKFPALTYEAVDGFLSEILMRALVIENIADRYALIRDPKDSKYINLALAANAPFLVSRDKDLLDLMDTTTSEGKNFRDRFPQLRILDPRNFVQQVLHQAR